MFCRLFIFVFDRVVFVDPGTNIFGVDVFVFKNLVLFVFFVIVVVSASVVLLVVFLYFICAPVIVVGVFVVGVLVFAAFNSYFPP